MNLRIQIPRSNRFSCLAIIMTILLCGMSRQIECMGRILSEGASEVVEAGVKKVSPQAMELATKVLGDAASSSPNLLKQFAMKIDDVSVDLLARGGSEAAQKGAQEFAENAAKGLGNLQKIGLSKFGWSSLDDVGVDFLSRAGGLADDVVAKGGKMTTKQFGDVLDDVGIRGVDATKLKQVFGQSDEALKGLAGFTDDLGRSFTKTQNTYLKVGLQPDELAKAKGLELKLTTQGLSKAETKTLNRLQFKNASYGGKASKIFKSLSKTAKMPIMMIGGGMLTSVMFMLPSIFQSAFLAQQAQNAMLQTYIPPIKFGNVVLQLPDSAVNIANPLGSQWIYYGIPVDNPGEGLSEAAKAAYPGVSGPTSKNKISESVDNSYAQAFTVGATKKIKINRYNLDAKALATLPIFMSYSDQSWLALPWGAVGIPDATFTQMMINLDTGYIFYSDGTSQGIPSAPLVGSTTNGMTVSGFMSKKFGSAGTSDVSHTFKDYVDTYSSVKGNKVAQAILDRFNCACLANNQGVLSEDTLKMCAAEGPGTCLLTSTINKLAAGLVLNANGTVLTPNQNLEAEIAKGALGQVVPIRGLGSKLDSILQMFPGAIQNAMANSGALTISLGSDLSSANAKATIQGAQPDNYAAKGIYVYECKNTPLAKILRNQSGGSADTNSQIVDYIVFLDANLNHVPLMAPVQDPKNYNFITMGLNPAIAYFSTIIGSMDSGGQFSFLPQLNIQSPAALVAKGLPPTFPPLYGLKASGGSLAVNYNQNLTSVIGSVVASLLGNAQLGPQFKAMQAAMMSLLTAGPYGKYNLVPVAGNMQPVIGGVNLMLYTGFNGYPVSQDKANAGATDVLIPLSSQGKTVTLPSNNVAQYYGLVTDLTYTVQADGTITVDPSGFENSPLSQNLSIDSSKVSEFYWMSKLTAMGQGNDPNFVMPAALTDFVTKTRTVWINWIKSMAEASRKSGVSSVEFAGVNVAGTSSLLTIASQQALQYGLYIYTCTPCPSTAPQDFFVLTNSTSPQANDASLGKMSATKATQATNMLSLVSGLLYNLSGDQVLSSSGAAYSVKATTLLTTINAANPQALSNDLKIKLNISVGKAETAAMAMVYPFAFGTLQLGLYQADIDKNVYLYFDAAGAGASVNFEPSDYFVVIDSYTSPSKIGAKLSSSAPYMVSLVSGKVSGPDGFVSTMPVNMTAQIIGALSPQWRTGVAARIGALATSLAAQYKAAAQQTAVMESQPKASTGVVKWSQSDVMKVINNIAKLDYLPDPYFNLKQDPASGMYVLVTPGNLEGDQSMYTFFSVPSTMVDADGKAMNIGASYDDQADLLRVIDGIELISMMNQSGISIDSNGKQYLGASNSLPIMKLDPADLALKPGMSGKSMLVSTDKLFPSHGIVSPVSYQNSQFYFYYNIITQGYYAMQVSGSDIRYIDMAGGSVYNLNGSPRMSANPVAVNSNGDLTDMLLPYANPDGFIRCVMKNPGNKNIYADFYNSAQDFQVGDDPVTEEQCGYNLLYAFDGTSTPVNISQMPFPDPSTLTAMPDISSVKSYNVYFEDGANPITYNVSSTYKWQNLQILPIDMKTRALLNPEPDDMYTNAGLVGTSNGMYAMVFANKFYSDAQKSGVNAYTMKSGSSSITVSMQMDAKTNAQYIQVIAGGVTYNYQCPFMTLIESQLEDYRQNAWQAEVIADVMGNILLEQYISIDGAGSLQLAPVSNNAVTGIPNDPAAKSAISAALGYILQDVGTGRYLAQVPASRYPYFDQDGFVDLENGALFDMTGMVVGYTIQYADLMNFLSSLSIAITRDANDKPVLKYRAPLLTAAINPAMADLDPSYVPSAAPVAPVSAQAQTNAPAVKAASQPAPTYSSVPAAQVSASAEKYVPVVKAASQPAQAAQAPVSTLASQASVSAVQAPISVTAATQASAHAPVQKAQEAPASASKVPYYVAQSASTQSKVAATNPQIAKLQARNEKLRADIALRSKQLATETIAHRKQVLKNAILTNQQQIALDNKEIVALGGMPNAKSNILGRFSSKTKTKKSSASKVKNS